MTGVFLCFLVSQSGLGIYPYCTIFKHNEGGYSIANKKIHAGQRHGKAGDPKEGSTQSAGLRFRDKQMQNLRRQGGKAGNKTGRHRQGHLSGKSGYFTHPLVILGGKVIPHQRHKALAQPHGNIQRELVNTLHHAIGCYGNVAVAGGEMYHHHIGSIAKGSSQSRRQTYRKNGPYKAECEVPGV